MENCVTDNYVFSFDNKTEKYCLEKLTETNQVRDQCLKEIRDWLAEEKHLHVRLETKHLLGFLRSSKFNLEETKVKITNFYTMKRDRIEWFNNRDPLLPEIQELVKLGVFVPLKKMHDNKLVVIIRTAAHDPKRHKQSDVFKAGKMVLDVACLENELVQIYGITTILDMANISFGHYKEFTPSLIKNMVLDWQNNHVRPERLEFVNSPFMVNTVISIFKGFMTKEMRDKVRVHHGGNKNLEKIIPVDILPKEYGGNGESIQELGQYWCEKIVKYRDWFLEDEKYKAE